MKTKVLASITFALVTTSVAFVIYHFVLQAITHEPFGFNYLTLLTGMLSLVPGMLVGISMLVPFEKASDVQRWNNAHPHKG